MKISYSDYIKKSNVSVLVAEAIFFELEKKYCLMKIEDVAYSTSGGTPLRTNAEFYGGNIPWLKSGELNDGYIEKVEEFITEKGLSNSSAKVYPVGTLLIAMYGATVGKTGITKIETTTNQAICAVFPKVDIEKDYIYWFFRSHRYKFIEMSKGGAQPNISQSVILNTKLPVPPKDVQKMIISILHEINQNEIIDFKSIPSEFRNKVKQIVSSKNNLTLQETELIVKLKLLKQLRQAFLREAMQGILVPQDKNDEPASELIKRIKAEKACPERSEGTLKKKKQMPLPEIKPEEIPYEIPESWIWCRLGEIISISSGDGLIAANMDELGKIPVYGGNGITGYHSKNNINKETIVIGRVGAYCGSIHLSEKIAWVTDNAFITKYSESNIDREWLIYCLKAINLRKLSFDGAQPVISGKRINPSLIPLPPLAEQQRIVTKLEQLMQLCSELEKNINQSKEETNLLLQTVLREALEEKEN